MSPEERLSDLGFALSKAPAPAAKYQLLSVVDGWAYVSGCLPLDTDGTLSRGKLGVDCDLSAGKQAARLCAANGLRILWAELGSLSRVARVVRVGGYVNCDSSFEDIHLVVNGASELLVEVLGDAGRHARSAIGVASLPLGAAVEVDIVARIQDGESS